MWTADDWRVLSRCCSGVNVSECLCVCVSVVGGGSSGCNRFIHDNALHKEARKRVCGLKPSQNTNHCHICTRKRAANHQRMWPLKTAHYRKHSTEQRNTKDNAKAKPSENKWRRFSSALKWAATWPTASDPMLSGYHCRQSQCQIAINGNAAWSWWRVVGVVVGVGVGLLQTSGQNSAVHPRLQETFPPLRTAMSSSWPREMDGWSEEAWVKPFMSMLMTLAEQRGRPRPLLSAPSWLYTWVSPNNSLIFKYYDDPDNWKPSQTRTSVSFSFGFFFSKIYFTLICFFEYPYSLDLNRLDHFMAIFFMNYNRTLN